MSAGTDTWPFPGHQTVVVDIEDPRFGVKDLSRQIAAVPLSPPRKSRREDSASSKCGGMFGVEGLLISLVGTDPKGGPTDCLPDKPKGQLLCSVLCSRRVVMLLTTWWDSEALSHAERTPL